MAKINHIKNIISNEAFQKLMNRDTLKLAEINSIMLLLISCNIPFELEFSEGTRSNAAAISFTVILSPTTSITRVIGLESGYIGGGFDV